MFLIPFKNKPKIVLNMFLTQNQESTLIFLILKLKSVI